VVAGLRYKWVWQDGPEGGPPVRRVVGAEGILPISPEDYEDGWEGAMKAAASFIRNLRPEADRESFWGAARVAFWMAANRFRPGASRTFRSWAQRTVFLAMKEEARRQDHLSRADRTALKVRQAEAAAKGEDLPEADEDAPPFTIFADMEIEDPEGQDFLGIIERRDLYRRVEDILQGMRDQDLADVFRCHVIEGKSQQETARELHCDYRSVRVRSEEVAEYIRHRLEG
jgi:RNA polymerase sigma factor (sigma-70 family)